VRYTLCVVHLTRKPRSDVSVSVTDCSEDEAWDASHLVQCYKSKMWHCCYPSEDVSPQPNIKTLLMLLQEHSQDVWGQLSYVCYFRPHLNSVVPAACS